MQTWLLNTYVVLQRCRVLLSRYMSARFYRLDDEEIGMLDARDEHQILRHFVLVIMLSLTQLAVSAASLRTSQCALPVFHLLFLCFSCSSCVLYTLPVFQLLFLCFWRLFNEQQNGLYLELEFLNVVLISGQVITLPYQH